MDDKSSHHSNHNSEDIRYGDTTAEDTRDSA